MPKGPDMMLEKACGDLLVCGVDEAGRGPWAGPVSAAAVILNPRKIPKGLDDSKIDGPSFKNDRPPAASSDVLPR